MKIYHVTQDWNGGNLESLYEQHGEEAYAIYAEKWPESNGLAFVHAHYIHCHSTRDDAEEYAEIWGGDILEINIDDDNIEYDSYEYNHPMVKDCVPKNKIKKV